MKTYRIGDTITVEVELQDQSGIGSVAGNFQKVGGGGGFAVNGEGVGQVNAKVNLIWQVSNAVPPGEYRLVSLIAYDMVGNRLDATSPPDIRLMIESDSADREPPKLVSVELK